MNNSVSNLQEKLADESLESYENIEVNVATLRKVFSNCEVLFQLLDNIDTAEDVAKSNDAEFRKIAGKYHRRRFEVATTDGHSVTFI